MEDLGMSAPTSNLYEKEHLGHPSAWIVFSDPVRSVPATEVLIWKGGYGATVHPFSLLVIQLDYLVYPV